MIDAHFRVTERAENQDTISIDLRTKNHRKVYIEAVELASGEIVVRVSGETRVALSSNISTITSDEYYRMEMNR